ncbi:hypothetical protein EAI_03330 [Harpegnathos saltator]|uniref:Uncharacterized protein n=1 Tax=Harpegnathos saltator TaxID=610380 RepID=E2C683_HARSA|nr:hypothetical protein EAI_03330 [Harpegnathos saltator]
MEKDSEVQDGMGVKRRKVLGGGGKEDMQDVWEKGRNMEAYMGGIQDGGKKADGRRWREREKWFRHVLYGFEEAIRWYH